MIPNQAPHSPIRATLTSLALLALLLAIAAPHVAAQSDSDPAYVIRANLPAAAVHDLSIRITIPAGMIFDGQSLQASGAASAPAVSVGSPNDGSSRDLGRGEIWRCGQHPGPGPAAHLPLPGGGRGQRRKRRNPAAHQGRAGLPVGGRRAADLLRRDGGRHCDRARPGSGEELRSYGRRARSNAPSRSATPLPAPPRPMTSPFRTPCPPAWNMCPVPLPSSAAHRAWPGPPARAPALPR